MVSTSSSAGWPAASSAERTAAMRLVTPVEVSLCTTATALIARSRSSASRASMRSGSAPVRQSPPRTSTSRPSRCAMFDQSVEKCPVSFISTASPGESVFTSAASQAPVPEDGKISTSPRVRKISRRPESTRSPSRPNSGPRWSMVGRSMARRIRSGTLVGPGIWRKCRPAGVVMSQRLPRIDAQRTTSPRAVYAGRAGWSHSCALRDGNPFHATGWSIRPCALWRGESVDSRSAGGTGGILPDPIRSMPDVLDIRAGDSLPAVNRPLNGSRRT